MTHDMLTDTQRVEIQTAIATIDVGLDKYLDEHFPDGAPTRLFAVAHAGHLAGATLDALEALPDRIPEARHVADAIRLVRQTRGMQSVHSRLQGTFADLTCLFTDPLDPDNTAAGREQRLVFELCRRAGYRADRLPDVADTYLRFAWELLSPDNPAAARVSPSLTRAEQFEQVLQALFPAPDQSVPAPREGE